ncbi:uncharacterized protein BO88DRAFT_407146 [Aspergillus vadensis CBS 113365]|uniref:RING-type domain-containing protein n=1 Tax=Aspergillus vadensis (strain CBS 113365 / IMI 142717 / IBT 24658) TaxID=1448311 RepID=A0A319B150_ASPVC|nr:hypothetical protein BO88DRAFT_407146 [Aspergillus vadensis CBS 113365]PYH66219.1 hypothetical protein BO88DRAFT_407146 [Aspergillus vadensis CBS 113365]
MAGDTHHTGIVGVIVGAVVLFVALSTIPFIVLYHHRRRATARRSSELRNLTDGGIMRQVSVDRWLDEQTHASCEDRLYAQESCPICLSTLAASQDTLPFPEPAWVAPSPHDEPNLHDTMEADRVSGRRNILVLNRCHHVFHASCLASWFEYHQYRCPICQTSYFSE